MKSVTSGSRVQIARTAPVERERTQGAALGGYLCVLVASAVVGKSAADALFLRHFSAVQLMYADFQNVVAVGLALGLYLRLTRVLTLPRMVMWSSLIFAIGDVACWWAATGHQAWLARAIYCWV